MPTYGKVKVQTLTYDSSGSAVDLAVGDIAPKASPTFTGTITGATAVLTGNLTVDTNTLYVDATNNRVGIGTTSASQDLHILGTQAGILVEGSVQGRIILRDNAATDATARNFDLVSVDENFKLRKLSDNFASASDYLTIEKSGNATFAGTVSDSKGDLRNIPINSRTAAYTLVVGDAGKVVGNTTGGWTIPAGVFTTVGQTVTLLNNSGSAQNITASALTYLYNTADGANIKASTIALGARAMATIWFDGGATGYIQSSKITVS